MDKEKFFLYHRDGLYDSNKNRIFGLNDYEILFLQVIFDSNYDYNTILLFIKYCINNPILSENTIKYILYTFGKNILIELCCANPNVSGQFILDNFVKPDTFMMENSNSEDLILKNDRNIYFGLLSYFHLQPIYSEKCAERIITSNANIFPYFPYWNPNLSERFYEKYNKVLVDSINVNNLRFSESINAEYHIVKKILNRMDRSIFVNPKIPDDLLIEWNDTNSDNVNEIEKSVFLIYPMRNVIFDRYIKNKPLEQRIDYYSLAFFSYFRDISRENIDFIISEIEFFTSNRINERESGGGLCRIICLINVISDFIDNDKFLELTLKIIHFGELPKTRKSWFYENVIVKDRINREILLFSQLKNKNIDYGIKSIILDIQNKKIYYKGITQLASSIYQIEYTRISPKFLSKDENLKLFYRLYISGNKEKYCELAEYYWRMLPKIDPLELVKTWEIIKNKRDFAPHCSGYYSAKQDYEKNCERINK